MYFDFGEIRKKFYSDPALDAVNEPVVASGGMVAIRKGWRARRDVIRALYRVGISIFFSWKATHVIATVNSRTTSMYRRLGFGEVGEKIWVEQIGDYITPLAAPASLLYEWSFSELSEPRQEVFHDSFERVLLRLGETLFREGQPGDRAYVIDAGNIKISRARPEGPILVLAILGRGDLFGELALIDDLPRSATAEALGDVELIGLDRKLLSRQTGMNSDRLRAVMHFFSSRIRKTGDLAMVLAFEAPEKRLEFALDSLRQGARPDTRRPRTRVAHVMVDDLARAALVEKRDAQQFLEGKEARGEIVLGKRGIRFLAPEHPPDGDT